MVLGPRRAIGLNWGSESHQLMAGVWRHGSGWISEAEKLQREKGRGQDTVTTRFRGAGGARGGKKDPRKVNKVGKKSKKMWWPNVKENGVSKKE